MADQNDIFVETRDMIIRDFELEAPSGLNSEESLLDYVADVVAYYIEKNKLEFLFQVLYRLDVDEQKMRAAFAPENEGPANISLAKAIIEREKQRVLTRRQYRSKGSVDWFDF